MNRGSIGEFITGLSPASKKELLDGLIAALVGDLTEAERREALGAALTGREGGRELGSMVEY